MCKTRFVYKLWERNKITCVALAEKTYLKKLNTCKKLTGFFCNYYTIPYFKIFIQKTYYDRNIVRSNNIIVLLK